MTRTHYQALGVSETASQDEIRRAYLRLAKRYHPDRNKAKGAEDRFKEINLAYQVLKDPGTRQVYDYDLAQSRKATGASASGTAGQSSPPPPPPPRSSGSASAAAQPPPTSATQAYRLFFLIRGILIGGGFVAIVAVLVLLFLFAGRKSSVRQVELVSVPLPIKQKSPPESSSAIPQVAPAPDIPRPTPEPVIPTPEPATVVPTPEPTIAPEADPQPEPPAVPEQVAEAEVPPSANPIHLCGQWQGSYSWYGTRVPFFIRLEERGDELHGIWRETHADGTWTRTTISGRVRGSSAALTTLVRTPDAGIRMTKFVCLYASRDLLRGIVESRYGREPWEARRVSDCWEETETWRLRSAPAHSR